MPDKTLVIVESPAKAKKIAGYLGPNYQVLASVGHIRDLAARKSDLPKEEQKKPWAKLAVNVDEGYQAFYVIHESKKATIAELKRALKDSDELLLATDEDREGEAISWHLLEVLRPKVPVKRMVFNEITKEAIQEAVNNPRDVDMNLVEAQETRRIVDRLYGYPVSEVLWKKIGREAKSAGRVQSVAVRLVVDRERERIAFNPAGYWDVKGIFSPGVFGAKLVSLDGKRIVAGGDFGDDGNLTKSDLVLLNESDARELVSGLASAKFTVRSVVQKPGQRKPKAPFTTSTLQQEASGRFRWGAQRTMRVAQGLYENGYITYMRTDSVNLSEQAINAAKKQARELYGPEYVDPQTRTYPNKSKNAQEAHEAIRPAGDSFRTPGDVAKELTGDEFLLYELIWKRTVASQMVNAQVATTTIRLGATTSDNRDAEFSAAGTVVVFPGFRAALADVVTDEDSEEDRELPSLAEGQELSATELNPEGHTTKPPARYTEASLVAKLEELGIGRPSTYASIMSTIVDRGYVWKKGSALVPSFTALAVVRLLEEHFSALVDYKFTANMEEELDLIALGEADRVTQLNTFWLGGDSLQGPFPGVKHLTEDLGAIDARGLATMPIRGTDAQLRVGRYGAYVERGEERANIPLSIAPDELTAELAEQLLLEPSGDRELGNHPDTGQMVVAKSGRYGPYVSEVLPENAPKSAKPRTASLFSYMKPSSVTLDQAIDLLNLPRVVGVDPESAEEITAQNGRYGPYLLKGKDSRSLDNEDRIFEVTLEEALQLYSQPKVRRGRGQAAGPLREVGADPTTGKLIVVKEGRFGAYVTDGEVNATLRVADDPMSVSLERAADLIAERRAKGPAVKKVAKRTVKKATKKATKKSTAKKATAKKTTAKVAKKAEPMAADLVVAQEVSS
jgi:DNA topoisomerase-1